MRRRPAVTALTPALLMVLLLATPGCGCGAEEVPCDPHVFADRYYFLIMVLSDAGVHMHITDPLGRELGISPASAEEVSDIPHADFDPDNDFGHDPAMRGDGGAGEKRYIVATADVPCPVEGRYRLELLGVLGAQGASASLAAYMYGTERAMAFVVVETGAPVPVVYEFTFSLDDEELVSELELVEE